MNSQLRDRTELEDVVYFLYLCFGSDWPLIKKHI
jgi:hypothetical protein